MEPTSDSRNKATATETTQGQRQAIPLFPTVCFVSEYQNIEALNNELQAFCLEQENSKQGIDSGSIQGGYHSSRDFFEFENESVQMLKELLMDRCTKVILRNIGDRKARLLYLTFRIFRCE